MIESDYIQENNAGELNTNELVLQFSITTSDSAFHLARVKEVVLSISKYNEDNWPNDQQWERILPKWFVEKIKSHSLDELNDNSTLLWDYGSWLDAMKFRGWQWLSSKIYIDKFIINLVPLTSPFSVNPIEYVIFESGVGLSKIIFSEIRYFA